MTKYEFKANLHTKGFTFFTYYASTGFSGDMWALTTVIGPLYTGNATRLVVIDLVAWGHRPQEDYQMVTTLASVLTDFCSDSTYTIGNVVKWWI